MSLYLVTGGAGFIGSHIVATLVKNGEKVRVLDNFITGKKENLAGVMNKIRLITGDIRNVKTLKKSLTGVDYVLHQAALRSVPRSIEDPVSSNDVNITGTLLLLKTAHECKVKRVVIASSSSIYGDNPKLPKREDQLPSPISPYAASKIADEYYCQIYSKIFGVETVCLRYFNVFGPKQDPKSEYAAVIPKFIVAALTNRTITVHGDGLQSRDFSYIDNVVSANLLAAKAKNVSGEVFNIACGERHTLMEMVGIISKVLNKKLNVVHTKSRIGDVKHTLADIRKSEKLLGYKTKVNFNDGMKLTIDYFVNLNK
jgi:nucleoside-diphosphate-sugar epimerase